jgi:2-polyprenyl-6-methoxyphenol hydroxylase-like FAD-dependent oxidoreductase
MSASIGKLAVVVGAGMGGLAAAKALSAHFNQVTVLDRDALPSTPQPRQGTPQSRHPHALLLSGGKLTSQGLRP